MKYFIASDIHGSAYYCRRLLEAYEREGADRLVLLGDILYHGPRNDLPKDYNPKDVFAMLNEKKDAILCVRGNCDSEVDQMVLEFPIMAPYAILTQGSLVVYATHGDHYNTHRLPPLQKGDILLHGHTHLPVWEPFGQDNYYLNPGSASLPKDGNPHSYLRLGRSDLYLERHGRQGLPRTDFIRSREKGAACLFGTVGIGPPSGSSPIREKSENQTDGRP